MTPDLGTLWQWVVITVLGLYTAHVKQQRREEKLARKEEQTESEKALSAECEKLEREVQWLLRSLDTMKAVVDTQGTLVMCQLRDMNGKMDKLVTEQAELRGAAAALVTLQERHTS